MQYSKLIMSLLFIRDGMPHCPHIEESNRFHLWNAGHFIGVEAVCS